MAEKKITEYTLRIAGKRQVTLPDAFVNALNLRQGDELRVVCKAPNDIRLVPYARVRRDLITPEIEAILSERRAQIEGGEEMTAHEEVLRRAALKNTQRRVKVSKSKLETAAAEYRKEMAEG